MQTQEELIKKLADQEIRRIMPAPQESLDSTIQGLADKELELIYGIESPSKEQPQDFGTPEEQRAEFISYFMQDPSIINDYVDEMLEDAVKVTWPERPLISPNTMIGDYKLPQKPEVVTPEPLPETPVYPERPLPQSVDYTAGIGKYQPEKITETLLETPVGMGYPPGEAPPETGERILNLFKDKTILSVDLPGWILSGFFKALGNIPGVARDLPGQIEQLTGYRMMTPGMLTTGPRTEGAAEKMRELERSYLTDVFGYYPQEESEVISGIGKIATELTALSGALRGIAPIFEALPNIPVVKNLAGGVAAGTIWAMMHKPEDDSVWERAKNIPADVVVFTALNLGYLTGSQLWRMLQWSRKYGKIIGPKVTYEEVMGLAQKIRSSEYGGMTVDELARSLSPAENRIFEYLGSQDNWGQILRKLKAQGPLTIFEGGVAPPKPQWSDLFRPYDPVTGEPIRRARPTEPAAPAEPQPEEAEGIVRALPPEEAPPPAVTVDVTPKEGGGWTYEFKFPEEAPPPRTEPPPPVTKTEVPPPKPEAPPATEGVKVKTVRTRAPKTFKNPLYQYINNMGGVSPGAGYSYSELKEVLPPTLIRKRGTGLDDIAESMNRVIENGGTLPFRLQSWLGDPNIGPNDVYYTLEQMAWRRAAGQPYVPEENVAADIDAKRPGEDIFEDYVYDMISKGKWDEISPEEQKYALDHIEGLRDELERLKAKAEPEPAPEEEEEFDYPPEWDEIAEPSAPYGEYEKAKEKTRRDLELATKFDVTKRGGYRWQPSLFEKEPPEPRDTEAELMRHRERIEKETGGKIGPFSGDLITPVLEGRKPISEIDNELGREHPEWKNPELKKRYKSRGVSWVYRKDNEADALARIARYEAIHDRIKRTGDVSDEDHAELGRLFGYSDADIEAHRKWTDLVHEAESKGFVFEAEPIQRELPGAERKERPAKYPGGYDVRGIRTFQDINTFLSRVHPIVERGYEIEYGHSGGRAGWARIVGKKEPGKGRLISKAKPPPKFGEPELIEPELEEIAKEQPKLFEGIVKLPKKRISHEEKDLTAEEQIRHDLPGLLKKLKVNPGIWGGVTEHVLKNYDPSMGVPLEHYLRASLAAPSTKGGGKRGFDVRKGKTPWDEETGERKKPKRKGEPKKVEQWEDWYSGRPDKDVLGHAVGPPAPEIALQHKQARLRMAEMIENKAKDTRQYQVANLRLMQPIPYTYEEIANRLDISKTTAKKAFDGFRGRLTVKELDRLHDWVSDGMKYYGAGMPFPSKHELRVLRRKLSKITRYFKTMGGIDPRVDRELDKRLGKILSVYFDTYVDMEKLDKWIRKNNLEPMREFIRDILTGDVSLDFLSMPQEMKDLIATNRGRIDMLSMILLENGNLGIETDRIIKANLGQYLTRKFRLYEEQYKFFPWRPSDEKIEAYKDWLRQEHPDGFGLYSEEELDDYVESILEGKIVPSALREHAKKGIKIGAGSLQHKRKLSQAEKDFYGEIVDPVWLTIKTVTDLSHSAFNAEFLNTVYDDLSDMVVDTLDEAKPKGWKNYRIPDNRAYGKLAGKYVDRDLYYALTQESRYIKNNIEKFFVNFFVNPFKAARTIFSIPTHCRNALGNPMFSFFMRCSIWNPNNWGYYSRTWSQYFGRKGKHQEEYSKHIKALVTETQFYGPEIPQFYDKLKKLPPELLIEKIFDNVIKKPAHLVLDAAGRGYNFEDLFYRMAAHLKNTEHFEMSPEESVAEINMGMTNYRKLPAIVDALRTYPILGPFISFRANVVKILASQVERGILEIRAGSGYGPPLDGRGGTGNPDPELRKKGLLRLVRVVMGLSFPWLISQSSKKITSMITGVPVKFFTEFEKFLPRWRKHGNFIYFPNFGVRMKGNTPEVYWKPGIKMFDLTYIYPTGDIERGIKAIFKGDVSSFTDTLNLFAHPAIDAYQILFEAKEPGEFGRELSNANIPSRALKYLEHIWIPQSAPVPSFDSLFKGEGVRAGALTPYQIKILLDAYWQTPDKYGRTRNVGEEVRAFFTGIRSWDMDPKKVMQQYIDGIDFELRSLEDRYRRRDIEIQREGMAKRRPDLAGKRETRLRSEAIEKFKKEKRKLMDKRKQAREFRDKLREMFGEYLKE